MKNKVLVELIVPDIDKTYNVYLPINKKVGNIINLLSKAITDTTNGTYISNNQTALYNSYTGDCYEIDLIIRKTNIRTGSRLVLM